MSINHAFCMVAGIGLLVAGMDSPVSCLSPQLLAVNRRLHELRAQAQAQSWPVSNRCSVISKQSSLQSATGDRLLNTDHCLLITDLPDHLGWESEALTAVLHRRQQGTLLDAEQQDWVACLPETAVAKPSAITHSTTSISPHNSQYAIRISNTQSDGWVKLYPDIGLGMLRQELTAPGRLWLMLRYLDSQGSGAIRIDILAQILTSKTSALRLCGKRQLRNLLRDGEGVFWMREKEYVWLRSAAKTALALGVVRLTGRPVALPVSALSNGIGDFRAHLYAAFHSSRIKGTPQGSQAMPIARNTLTELSGVGQSSQRTYETRANVKVHANFAVGEVAQEENRESRAWTQGQALFEIKDYRGQQGKKGKRYLAWQLPNSYIGQHQHRPKGRQKQINRKLKDLVMKGMPGNVEGTSETYEPGKVYYLTGKLAAKAYSHDSKRDLYWRRHETENGRFGLWQQL